MVHSFKVMKISKVVTVTSLALFGALLALKLFKVYALPWLWVWAPLWIPFIVALIVVVCAYIIFKANEN